MPYEKKGVKKKKSRMRYFNLSEMLSQRFREDKTVIRVFRLGDIDDSYDLTTGDTFKVYLATGQPRIYINNTEVWAKDVKTYFDLDDCDTEPRFKVLAADIYDADEDVPRSHPQHGPYDNDDELNQCHRYYEKTDGSHTHDMPVLGKFDSMMIETFLPYIQNFFDDLMSQGKLTRLKEVVMKRLLNRLNGIQLAEEGLVELRQNKAEKANINLDLVALLQESPAVKELKLGDEALLTGLIIDEDNGQLALSVSKGKVIKEENSAIAQGLKSLINKAKSQ